MNKERMHQVNRMLDRACKRANVDPIETRLAMIQALNDKVSDEPIVMEDNQSGMTQYPKVRTA